MLHLIKKDILVQKRSFVLSVVLMVFFSISFSGMGPGGLGVAMMTIAYMLVLGASAVDDKNNSDKILISLPIRKNTIVLSKYLSIFVFIAYAIFGFFAVYVCANFLQFPIEIPFTRMSVAVAFASGIIYFAITLPLVFKFGYLKSRMPSMILLFTVIFGVTPFLNILAEGPQHGWGQKVIEFLNGLTPVQSVLVIFVPLLILLTISYIISLEFYKRREF